MPQLFTHNGLDRLNVMYASIELYDPIWDFRHLKTKFSLDTHHLTFGIQFMKNRLYISIWQIDVVFLFRFLFTFWCTIRRFKMPEWPKLAILAEAALPCLTFLYHDTLQFYMKTGECKFGERCKFHHPLDRSSPVTSSMEGQQQNVKLSLAGLPRREVCHKFYHSFTKHGCLASSMDLLLDFMQAWQWIWSLLYYIFTCTSCYVSSIRTTHPNLFRKL